MLGKLFVYFFLFNLFILKNSWIVDASSKLSNSDASTSDVKKKYKGPKFLVLSPKRKLPLLLNENDQTNFSRLRLYFFFIFFFLDIS